MRKGIIKIGLLILLFAYAFSACQKLDFDRLTKSRINSIEIVSSTSVNAEFEIIDLSDSEHKDFGICFSHENVNPDITGNKLSLGDKISVAKVNKLIEGLLSGKTYYFRAYVMDEGKPVYSTNVIELFLPDYASVITSSVYSITPTSAMVPCTVSGDGGSPVTARGLCWSTSQNPDLNDSCSTNGSGLGSFTVILSGLLPGTTYHVRAFATNGVGTLYGNEQTFTTPIPGLAELSTSSISYITTSSAKGGGTVTADGWSSVTQRGICWSKLSLPTIDDSKISSGSGLGSFTSDMTGLDFGSTYYVRAYATNSSGTHYGNEVSFTTLVPGAPVLSTKTVSSITDISAVSGGDISSDGGSAVTARGVCWSISTNPTLSDNYTINGTGTGSYTSNLTGLVQGTNYYVRAYATNTVGTSYGNQQTFTTRIPGLATIVTTQISAIFRNKASCGGNITDDGGSSVSERGICWSTLPNPTTLDNKLANGVGIGSFTAQMTELLPNTLYYVRSYAINGVGTVYGEERSFETAPEPIIDIDGNVYELVRIGNQVWMASNLRTTKYRDGTVLPNITNNTEWFSLTSGAFCNYDNNASSSDIYGRLYNFFAIKENICPSGWHVPNESEWMTLINFLGGEYVAGGKMKESGTIHWSSPNTGATNMSGFTGLPGSYRNVYGEFSTTAYLKNGYWWSSTEKDAKDAFYFRLHYDNDDVSKIFLGKTNGFSIRCIQDEK